MCYSALYQKLLQILLLVHYHFSTLLSKVFISYTLNILQNYLKLFPVNLIWNLVLPISLLQLTLTAFGLYLVVSLFHKQNNKLHFYQVSRSLKTHMLMRINTKKNLLTEKYDELLTKNKNKKIWLLFLCPFIVKTSVIILFLFFDRFFVFYYSVFSIAEVSYLYLFIFNFCHIKIFFYYLKQCFYHIQVHFPYPYLQ